MFAILGSGFGLYGYLPALMLGCEQQIVLPERYREILSKRADVQALAKSVHWVVNEEKMLGTANSVVIAIRPEDQMHWVRKCLEYKNIERLILEKPLASTPEIALQLIELLESSGKIFRVSYNFRYTSWAHDLFDYYRQNPADSMVIDWKFRAHHYEHNLDNWKRYHSSGGGALRFYGIHLIALLAELGYSNVQSSEIGQLLPEEVKKWNARITGNKLSACQINLDTDSNEQNFSISIGNDKSICSLSHPFEIKEPLEANLDQRIDTLIQLCNDLLRNDQRSYPEYRQSVILWQKIEDMSNYVSLGNNK